LVNRLRLQAVAAGVGLLAIAVALAYFLLVLTPVNEPAPGGTYVEGVVVDANPVITLNPLLATTDSLSQDAASLLFSGLTRSVPGKNANEPGQVIEPDLADHWTASSDGLLWEFYLRQNARWQDGTPVTARDVVYTINLLKSDDFPGGRELTTLWKQVEVSRLGDYAVRFRLQQPWPAFLNYTTQGLLPAHKLEGKIKPAELATTDFNKAPVGSGPYQLAPGGFASDGVTLIANPLYYGKKPYLDKIWFRFYPSANAALSALQADQIDGVSEVTSDEIKRVSTLKNITEVSAPRARNTFMFLNLQRSDLFGQKEVRQALSYAINKPLLIDKALSGQAQASSSPILASSWAYKKDIKTYNYDPAQAEKLLDAAGWKVNRDGIRERNGQPLIFQLLIDDSADKRAVATQIAENLRSMQIVVKIDVATSLVELDKSIKAGSYDALLFTVVGALNDPDPYTNWHSNYADAGDNHFNLANWRLDRADRLLESARVTINQDERAKLYFQWQDIWADELPSIPLYSSTYSYVVSNRVGGVQTDSLKVLNLASDRFKDIALWHIFTSTKFGA
jgi:peptide/nickel transport system substrate-binding protein